MIERLWRLLRRKKRTAENAESRRESDALPSLRPSAPSAVGLDTRMISLTEVRQIRCILPRLIDFYQRIAEGMPLPPPLEPCCPRALPVPDAAEIRQSAGRLRTALCTVWTLAERTLERRGLGMALPVALGQRLVEGGAGRGPDVDQLVAMRRTTRWLVRWYRELAAGAVASGAGPEQTGRQLSALVVAWTLERSLALAELEVRRQALVELTLSPSTKL